MYYLVKEGEKGEEGGWEEVRNKGRKEEKKEFRGINA